MIPKATMESKVTVVTVWSEDAVQPTVTSFAITATMCSQ